MSTHQKKDYSAKTQAYLSQRGLVKAFVRDPATGENRCVHKSIEDIHHALKNGRFIYVPKS